MAESSAQSYATQAKAGVECPPFFSWVWVCMSNCISFPAAPPHPSSSPSNRLMPIPPFHYHLSAQNLTFLVKTKEMTSPGSLVACKSKNTAEESNCSLGKGDTLYSTTDPNIVLCQQIFSRVLHHTDPDSRPSRESRTSLLGLVTYSMLFYWTPTNLAQETMRWIWFSLRCLPYKQMKFKKTWKYLQYFGMC